MELLLTSSSRPSLGTSGRALVFYTASDRNTTDMRHMQLP